MPDPLDDFVQLINDGGAVERLRTSGYMSGVDKTFTGKGFACGNCRHYRREGPQQGDCLHRRIAPATVERTACCNRFRYGNISTE